MGSQKKHRLLNFIRKNEVAKTALLIVLIVCISQGSFVASAFALHTYPEYPVMVVVSGSMVPTLEIGDLIIVRGVDPGEITVGTIIVFHDPSNYNPQLNLDVLSVTGMRLIVHRVYGLEQKGNEIYFRTKGDHNPVPDPWIIPANYVVGVVIGRIPYVGTVIMKLREPFGRGVIIILILVLVIYMFIEAGGKQRKEKSAELQGKRSLWQALYKWTYIPPFVPRALSIYEGRAGLA